MRLHKTTLMACAVLASVASLPSSVQAKNAADTYPDVGSIPPVLVHHLRKDMFLEDYVAMTLRFVRMNKNAGEHLDQSVIDDVLEREIRQAEAQQGGRLVRYDLNRDTFISSDEIRQWYQTAGEGTEDAATDAQMNELLDRIMLHDQDKDGKISYPEMLTLRDDKKDGIRGKREIVHLRELLALDPDADGKVTVRELDVLSRKAFSTLDKDGDNRISADEYLLVTQAKVNARTQEKLLRGITAACAFKDVIFPDNMKIYATGAYKGRGLGFQIDQSGHTATQMDVVVNETAAPVALLIGAYEPTVWNIRHTPGTKIVAVVVGGYHKQIVTGLDKSIPVIVSTHQEKGVCGYFYFAPDKLEKLNILAREIFKKPADMFFPVEEEGMAIVGIKDVDAAALAPAEVVAPESFKIPDSMLAGESGLKEAVRQGILRPATMDDANAWTLKILKREKKSPTVDVPPMQGGNSILSSLPHLSFQNAYVVLKEFTYPGGLYGAHAVTFVIPEGVPMPKGKPGHSAVYDFNTLQCYGALCE